MITPANFPTVRISDTMPERPISSLARKMTRGTEAGQQLKIFLAERNNESKRLPEIRRETLKPL